MSKRRKFDSSKVYVGYAGAIKGRGVFASKRIRKGETVEIAPTIPLNYEDIDFISHTKLSYFTYGDDDRCTVVLGYGSLYNHSDKPNVEYIEGDHVMIYKALRTIKKNEELLIDYGWDSSYKEDFE